MVMMVVVVVVMVVMTTVVAGVEGGVWERGEGGREGEGGGGRKEGYIYSTVGRPAQRCARRMQSQASSGSSGRWRWAVAGSQVHPS